MSYKNLAEVHYAGGILKLLRNNTTRFAILVVTLESTPDVVKVTFRRWLKTKSKQFSNVLFIYFCASTNDIKDSELNLLSKNVDGFPYVYHLVDAKHILVEVENANNETINSSFDEVKHHYIKDLQEQKKDEEISDNECDKSEYADKKGNNIPSGNSQINTGNIAIPDQKTILMNKKLEQSKLLEKIKLMDDRSKKFMVKFMKDLKNRKKSEEE